MRYLNFILFIAGTLFPCISTQCMLPRKVLTTQHCSKKPLKTPQKFQRNRRILTQETEEAKNLRRLNEQHELIHANFTKKIGIFEYDPE